MRSLPYFCRGPVIRGFGRGSKELGIPTANFPEAVVDSLPADISTGIYYGWGRVDNGDIHKMVMSIGWNPYYKNTKKSMMTQGCTWGRHVMMASSAERLKQHVNCNRSRVSGNEEVMKSLTSFSKHFIRYEETHLIHKFKEDFYGQMLSVVMVGYIRPERGFSSLEELITAIHSDIEEAKRNLDLPEHIKLKEDNFFRTSISTTPDQILNGH